MVESKFPNIQIFVSFGLRGFTTTAKGKRCTYLQFNNYNIKRQVQILKNTS